MNTNKTPKTVKLNTHGNNIITNDNIQNIANAITLKALKTVYQRSGQDFILKLYNGLVADCIALTVEPSKLNTKFAFSDGFDLSQTAILYLLDYLGKNLLDYNGNVDKNGKPITIIKGCFKVVNNAIMDNRKREYKKIYIDDLNGNYRPINKQQVISNIKFNDLKVLDNFMIDLKLSAMEQKILQYRFDGLTLGQIAKILSITQKKANDYMARVRNKIAKKIGCDKLSFDILKQYIDNK